MVEIHQILIEQFADALATSIFDEDGLDERQERLTFMFVASQKVVASHYQAQQLIGIGVHLFFMLSSFHFFVLRQQQ